MNIRNLLFLLLGLTFLISVNGWAQEKGDEAPKDDGEGEIASFTIAPKLGWAYFMEGNGHSVPAIGSRNALNIQFNLDFGGDGGSFELAPYYSYEDPGPWHAVGVWLGGVHRFRVLAGKLYPSIGGGMKLGYLIADGIDYGLEIVARIPVGVTYYVLPDLGIVGELGLGWAATAYKGAGLDFGASDGFYCDLMVGVRWP